ncbi:MAG: hypothetical protein IV108_11725 [Burkholderiales bacterium]|nr:hypothetical protein [Burkholderiales bacterium]
MSESSNSKFTILIFSGVLSVIVGVASGYGVNWLSEKKAELTYDITSIQAFPGQERIGIVAVRISNSGKKELENIDATVRFSDAEVKEVLFQGLTPQMSTKERSNVRFQIPFLNATEGFSVQILVSPNSQALQQPTVDLRAKGAIGIPSDRSAGEKSSSSKDLLTLIASAAATVLALMTAVMIKLRTSNVSFSEIVSGITKPATGHSGDQRDVFAYVLGFCGLTGEANLIRGWPRDLSYWSISDLLTDRWIAEGDEKNIRAGIAGFDQLVGYAELVPSSIRIIQLNIARLYIALNDLPSARKYLSLATNSEDLVISKRINLNPVFSQLKQADA